MLRKTPIKRKTPLRGNPETVKAWKRRSAKRLPDRAPKRRSEEATYGGDRKGFLARYPSCPVTGERTSQVHHSAKREGQWLNLQRYWIAVSASGHKIIEDHKRWAESVGLMVRIRESYTEHVLGIARQGLSLTRPVFYDTWNGVPFNPNFLVDKLPDLIL